jgi:cephalosporin hydroxylase
MSGVQKRGGRLPLNTSSVSQRRNGPSIAEELAMGLALVRRFMTVRYRKIQSPGSARDDVVTAFHRLFYEEGYLGESWGATNWRGIPVAKSPLDLWILQQILWDARPTLVIETGTAHGGSALFMANLLDLQGAGRVITIDIHARAGLPEHPRIRYLRGSSTSSEIAKEVALMVEPADRVLVVLDSNHECEHVLSELEQYSRLVSPGQYVIVEDTNVNNHPVLPEYGPGPTEAVNQFLSGHSGEFQLDRSVERYLFSFNSGGFLRKVR